MIIKHFFSLPTHRIWRLPTAPQKHHCFQTGVLMTKWNEVNKRPVLAISIPGRVTIIEKISSPLWWQTWNGSLTKQTTYLKVGDSSGNSSVWLSMGVQSFLIFVVWSVSNVFFAVFFLYIYNCFRFFFNCNTTYFFHCSYKKTIKM